MQAFSKGDRVRIDIPDETDVDHQAYHGQHGRVVLVLNDDADAVTGDSRDSQIYRVALENGEDIDFLQRDLCPPLDDSSGT